MIDRDDLLRRTDLAALLDELSPAPASRLGPTARWHCIDPGHDDQHPSITMFVDRHGVERWKCWSGGHGGTAIDALLVARGGSVADVLAELTQRAGTTPDMGQAQSIPPRSPTSGEVLRSLASGERRPAPDSGLLEYVTACEQILWRPSGRAVREYLVSERGLAPDVLKANRIGADPGPAMLGRTSGLPRGGPAAVLPTLDIDGGVAYVQARYVETVDGRSKYDNPSSRIATNPRIGWVTPPRVKDGSHLVVCEGMIDALSAASTGTSAVAVLGATYIDDGVAREIAKGSAGRQVVLAFDGDHAGRHAGESLAASLTSSGCNNRVLSIPDGFDVNTMLGKDDRWISREVEPAWPRHGVRQHELARIL